MNSTWFAHDHAGKATYWGGEVKRHLRLLRFAKSQYQAGATLRHAKEAAPGGACAKVLSHIAKLCLTTQLIRHMLRWSQARWETGISA